MIRQDTRAIGMRSIGWKVDMYGSIAVNTVDVYVGGVDGDDGVY